MAKKRMSKSLRKHIRLEKARIRRDVLDTKEQVSRIQQVYQKFFKAEVSAAKSVKNQTKKQIE